MADQQRGADPGRVIDRMAQQIGQLMKELSTATIIIEDQETEIALLRAQTQDQST